MATPDDIIEARRIANARRMAQTATTTPTTTGSPDDTIESRRIALARQLAQAAVQNPATSTFDVAAWRMGERASLGDTKPSVITNTPIVITDNTNTNVNTDTNTNTNTRTQQLPAGFTAGPFPKEFEKFFGAPGDILGYRINSETDKDGVTFYTLSVAQKGAYGEGVTGFSTFGARLMKDASGNWVSYMGKGSTTDSTTTNNVTGTFTASDGKVFTDKNSYLLYEQNIRNQNLAAASAAAAATAERKSAYDLLYQQFAKYGLQALVTPLESLIKEGVPASEFAIRLRETDAYQRRFAANKARINKGLAALSEAEYIGLEDQYQNIMRQYGMPESYYARGDMGIQQGFEKLIAGDVSAVELENRVSNAYNRVINANPEVVQALKQYYPNITNGDILSYVLDPEKALTDINKKITAAEIGGAAMGAGLGIDVARAEQLGAFGVTKAQAQQGYQTIAEFLPTEMKLSEIYRRQGLGPYNQAVAEAEVFGLSGAAEAAQQRKKYTQLEQAQFSGQAGVGALARERAGSF